LWERRGEGTPLLFLPGGALDTVELTWSEVIQRLPENWHLTIADLPGYGRSGAPKEATTAWYATWLAALLDDLALLRPFVVASSQGGAIALSLACAQPARVAGLVLSGAYGVQARVRLHAVAARLVRLPGVAHVTRAVLRRRAVLRLLFPLAIRHPEALSHDLLEDARAGLAPLDALEAFMAWLRDELRPEGCTTDLRPCLAGLLLPLLFIHGTHDPFVPLRAAEEAVRLAPDARLLPLDAAHLPPREHPDVVAEQVRVFVRAEVQTG
ncbi:MAG TPA: alpha/beta hydrolase, partial [Rhodothermales bacterium]|nr:alpha/beta hydrolase [Rhodothermales bacterium]